MQRFMKLSRAEMKNVLGGVDEDPGTGGGDAPHSCLNGFSCHYEESPHHDAVGLCETNSNNKCVCNGFTSSVLWSACVA